MRDRERERQCVSEREREREERERVEHRKFIICKILDTITLAQYLRGSEKPFDALYDLITSIKNT